MLRVVWDDGDARNCVEAAGRKEVHLAASPEGVTIHDLRRTFGLHIAQRAGLHVASKLLRHSDIRITERVYVPLGFEALREAIEENQRERGKVVAFKRNSH